MELNLERCISGYLWKSRPPRESHIEIEPTMQMTPVGLCTLIYLALHQLYRLLGVWGAARIGRHLQEPGALPALRQERRRSGGYFFSLHSLIVETIRTTVATFYTHSDGNGATVLVLYDTTFIENRIPDALSQRVRESRLNTRARNWHKKPQTSTSMFGENKTKPFRRQSPLRKGARRTKSSDADLNRGSHHY